MPRMADTMASSSAPRRNLFVMTNKAGKEHSHTLAEDAKVTCDGKACKVADVKAGTKIRVTIQPGDMKVATHVEAIDVQATFADTHDGKFVSITGHKLAMTDAKGKEHSHTLTKDATAIHQGWLDARRKQFTRNVTFTPSVMPKHFIEHEGNKIGRAHV